jgi:hypothetical protein
MIQSPNRLQLLAQKYLSLSWPWRLYLGYIVIALIAIPVIATADRVVADTLSFVIFQLPIQSAVVGGFLWICYWVVPQIVPAGWPRVIRWTLIAIAPVVFLLYVLWSLKDYETFG